MSLREDMARREPILVEEEDGLVSLPLPKGGDAAAVLEAAAQATLRGERVVMATVVQRKGSTPCTPGQKLMYSDRGACVGTVGGGAVERRVLQSLVTRCRNGDSDREGELTTYRLGASLGMCCGGVVEVLFESIPQLVPVVLVGAGHIGTATAPLLAQCGFVVTLADERSEWAARAQTMCEGLAPRVRCVEADVRDASRDISREGVVLSMTHDHQLDQHVIEWALREGFAFVGGVGSRAKAARTRTRLVAKGFDARDVERFRMPVGADIGARAPVEIAVAIVAELIAWRSSLTDAATKAGSK